MKTPKTLLSITACALISLSAFAAGDTVAPQTLSGAALYRDTVAIGYSSTTHFTQGAPLMMTGMQCFATANLGTNSVIQGLSNVTVSVATSVSSTSTGTWSAATVQVSSNGTWWISLTNLPTSSTIYWQCRLTDSLTNVYYYQQQIIKADPHL